MRYFFYSLSLLFFFSCTEEAPKSDAYGNFEATITTVSAEANGRLLNFTPTEGKQLKIGERVGQVDTTQLHLQRLQLRATATTLPAKLRDAEPEILVLQDQKRNLIRERDRLKNLVAAKAATPKQLDDLNGQIEVVEQQIRSARSQTQTTNRGILAERRPIAAQVNVINEQIRKATIYNPVAGTVLTKLAEPDEIVAMGSPLYRIANLDTLTLRAYTDGINLQRVKVGDEVQVLVDDSAETYRQLTGRVSYISPQAEFTPKTIQTKEERVNLVYAMKIRVPNTDGNLRIGMPAEVNFGGKTNTEVAKE